MSGPTGSSFARLAALAEILLVLALGNIVEALFAGLRILLRIGFIAAFGLALLWFRRGLGPRDAGLTRAGKPLGHLLRVGVVLGGFSSFLIALVFALHTIMPLGEGLAAWKEIRESAFDAAFTVTLPPHHKSELPVILL